MDDTEKSEGSNSGSSVRKDNDVSHDLLVIIKNIIIGKAVVSLTSIEDMLECSVIVSNYLPHLQILYKNHTEEYFSFTTSKMHVNALPVCYENNLNLKTLAEKKSMNNLEQMKTTEDILQDLLVLVENIVAGCAFISPLIIENVLVYRIDVFNCQFCVILSYRAHIESYRNDNSMLNITNNNQNNDFAEVSYRGSELLSNTELVKQPGFSRQVYLKQGVSKEPSKDDDEVSWAFAKYSEPKTLNSTANKRTHEKTPSGERPYVCTYCEKDFRDNIGKRRHEKIHTRERPHVCTYCEKVFRDICDKRRHERIHTGERPYACSYCDKTFTTRYCKIIHERIHTGERPYACTFCNKTFRTKKDTKIHERNHTGERPYACSYCDKRFTNIGNLRKHQRTNFKEKIIFKLKNLFKRNTITK